MAADEPSRCVHCIQRARYASVSDALSLGRFGYNSTDYVDRLVVSLEDGSHTSLVRIRERSVASDDPVVVLHPIFELVMIQQGGHCWPAGQYVVRLDRWTGLLAPRLEADFVESRSPDPKEHEKQSGMTRRRSS
jgi:hypothetical protein